jgi:hypothetical protein
MDYDYLLNLRKHPTWRLLYAESAPLIISFFYRSFIEPNVRVLAQSELVSMLDDYLYQLRQIYGEALYPRPAREYLDQWAGGDNAYLRKYYPPRGDEPEFDLTPASEKTIEWLRSLKQKAFIGTESRFLTIFQLLKDIVQATESDPQIRIRELEQQKQHIDQEIARLQSGVIDPHDPTLIKERFFQIEDTARQLLADFRQVEENFRQLDRITREKIAGSEQGKGALLDEIFGEQDAITKSDQGKSFAAFWSFLMSPARQQEFNALIQKVLAVDCVREVQPDEFLGRYKYHLMDAGEKTQRTSATLIEQLRKFLDDQAWLENKRIMELIHGIEKRAIDIKQTPPRERAFTAIDDVKPRLEAPMSRGLFQPPRNPIISDAIVLEGEADFETEILYNQQYVDEQQLRAQIRLLLQKNNQISLQELVQQFPIEKGLSEVVCYLNIASHDPKSVINSDARAILYWQNSHGMQKKASVPNVIFTR